MQLKELLKPEDVEHLKQLRERIVKNDGRVREDGSVGRNTRIRQEVATG